MLISDLKMTDIWMLTDIPPHLLQVRLCQKQEDTTAESKTNIVS